MWVVSFDNFKALASNIVYTGNILCCLVLFVEI